MGVDVITEVPFAVGHERELPIPDFSVAVRGDYDITPDGERFLMVLPVDQGNTGQVEQP